MKGNNLSTQVLLGVACGLAAAAFIGVFMAPRRYSKTDSVTFIVPMTVGAALANAVYWVFSGMPFEASVKAAFTLVPGAVWAVGSYAYAAGAARVGLAKASAIKNTQLVVTTAGGLVLFGEARTTNPALAVLGAALVIATAIILSRTEHCEERLPNASLKGYLVPIAASILYGINGLIMNWLLLNDVPRPLIHMGIGAGAVLGAVAMYFAVKKRLDFVSAARPREHALGLVGGAAWAMGLFAMLLAISYAGVAVGWALMNLSIVVSVMYGVVVLREIDIRARRLQIAAGLALAALGIISLTLAKVLATPGR